MAKIGDRSSVVHRVHEFVRRHREYLGTDPSCVVLFAEDFDVLEPRPREFRRFELVRGPSITEYVRP